MNTKIILLIAFLLFICIKCTSSSQSKSLNERLYEAMNPQEYHWDEIIDLIDDGANINTLNEDGETALMLASHYGFLKMVKHLLEKGAAVNAKTEGYTALKAASIYGHLEIVKLLLEKGADVDGDELTYASISGQLEVIELLIQKGADVHAKDEKGRTALIFASLRGHIDAVELFIQKGSDVNAKSNDSSTALIWACTMGHKEIVQLLVKNGADINAKDHYGESSLIKASFTGRTEIAKILLENGADVYAKDNKGYSSLVNARKKGKTDIFKLLLQYGANRADLVFENGMNWWFTNGYDSFKCIDRMEIIFENKSYSHVSSITFMITFICNENVIYKNKHTVSIDLEHGEVAPCRKFDLANDVWACSGTDFNDHQKKIIIDVDVLSVK